MSVILRPSNLRAGLFRVKPALGSSPNDMVRFVYDGDGEMCVSAAGLNMRIATLVDAEPGPDGDPIDVTMPAKLVGRISTAHQSGRLVMSIGTGRSLDVEHAESSWRYTSNTDWRTNRSGLADHTLVARDNPPRPPMADVWKVPGDVRRSMVRAAHIAGDDPARPALQQVWVDPAGRIAATDSFRLFVAEHIPTDLAPVAFGITSDVIGAIPSGTDEVLVTWADHYLELACDTATTITAQPGQGAFPNYEALVPWNPPVIIECTHAELVGPVKMMKAMLGDSCQPMRVSMVPDGLQLNAVVPNEHATTVDVPATYIQGSGKDVRLGLNAAGVLECIKAIDSDVVRICVTDNLRPVVFTPPTSNPKCLLMPVRY